jgi:Uma2 family endonuclease
LVVELVSPSDGGAWGSEALRRKLAAYLANGAQLGWLLFPEKRAVEIWRPGAEPQRLENAEVLDGEAVLPGLRLELAEI